MGARILATMLAAGTLASAAAPGVAAANGLTTHVWITRQARDKVPPGPLFDLVNDPRLEDPLVSGTLFPDGGYAVGHDYGELAHWAPLQTAYLEWIQAEFAPPWSPEARRHIAFLLGMASHGMADQVFDSLYMERARKTYDVDADWANESMDEASDVALAAVLGAERVPAFWVPQDAMIALFADSAGLAVDATTLERGQSLAGFAVAVVGMLAADPDAVDGYKQKFPWATEHILDRSIPGSPPNEVDVVAAYWQRVWARLNGTLADTDVIMATVPADGALGHVTSAESLDSRVSIIFARQMLRRNVSTDTFEWTSPTGEAVPFRVNLFYRDGSHVVHLIPTEDLAQDTDYTITVKAGVETADGARLDQPFALTVSTRAPPAGLDGLDGAASADGNTGCRCTAPSPAGGQSILLIGFVAALIVRRRR